MTNVEQQIGGNGARPRRTQEQRRAATRAALLDATIDGLVEHGYARLTTAQIVERAGVTRGAQAHYFSTKAELVVEALKRLSERIVAEVITHPPPSPDTAEKVAEAYLEQLWRVHTGEVFTAAVELWVAARTEPELRAPLAHFDRDLIQSVLKGSRELVPELAQRAEFRAWLQTALAAMRGLAMLRFVRDTGEVERMWEQTRRTLQVDIGEATQ